MNILTDILPSKIECNGSVFELETDYRAAVKMAVMIEKGEKDPVELCKPFFPNGFPKDIQGMVEAVIYFFRGGEKPTEKEEKETPKPQNNKPTWSFIVDSEAIYSDFWRYYNIDLATAKLHWWTFKSLLWGLCTDSNFKMRIYYRSVKLSDLPKGERKRIASIRKEIEIQTAETGGKMTLEQRNNTMLDYVTKRSKETRG